VYQWRKAFLLNMAVNCSEILLNSSWMAVEFPAHVEKKVTFYRYGVGLRAEGCPSRKNHDKDTIRPKGIKPKRIYEIRQKSRTNKKNYPLTQIKFLLGKRSN
jgi:hypothetical protein